MIKIIIPDIPPSLNVWSRMHWAKAAKIKKQWEHDIFYSVPKECQGKFCKDEFPLVKAKVRITFYFKTHARRDADNMNLKFLLDGLVKAGVIKDDSTAVIGQVEIVPEYDKERPRVEIEVFKEEV